MSDGQSSAVNRPNGAVRRTEKEHAKEMGTVRDTGITVEPVRWGHLMPLSALHEATESQGKLAILASPAPQRCNHSATKTIVFPTARRIYQLSLSVPRG